MRYRLSRAWPLDHGRLLAPSGTVIDSNSDDEWSRLARQLTPPWDVQALDDECYQLLLRVCHKRTRKSSPSRLSSAIRSGLNDDDEIQSHVTNGDDAFCDRMYAAIAAGLENAPIPKYFATEPRPLASSQGGMDL